MNVPPVQYAKTSDGYGIAYTVQGSGPPLMLLPFPGPHSITWWSAVAGYRRLYQLLASRFQVIAYDSRGEGLSDRRLRADHTTEDWQLDLDAVADAAGLERFVIYGQAAGSHVGVRYAVDQPERVRALVFWNSGTMGPGQFGWMSYMHDTAAENWELFVDMASAARFPEMGKSERIEHYHRAITQADWLTRTRALNRDNIEPLLSRVSVPALLITGGATPGLGDMPGVTTYGDVGKRIASVIPSAKLVVLEEAEDRLASVDLAVRAIEIFVAQLPPPDGPRVVPASDKAQPSPAVMLSARQRDVLRLIAEGKTTREIAGALFLSERTVERHIADAYAKIGARNRAEATAYALHRLG